jgi:hypothetical protein
VLKTTRVTGQVEELKMRSLKIKTLRQSKQAQDTSPLDSIVFDSVPVVSRGTEQCSGKCS